MAPSLVHLLDFWIASPNKNCRVKWDGINGITYSAVWRRPSRRQSWDEIRVSAVRCRSAWLIRDAVRSIHIQNGPGRKQTRFTKLVLLAAVRYFGWMVGDTNEVPQRQWAGRRGGGRQLLWQRCQIRAGRRAEAGEDIRSDLNFTGGMKKFRLSLFFFFSFPFLLPEQIPVTTN